MKWLKEPLVLFILLGAALTLVYSVAFGAFAADESKTVAMDAAEIEILAANWERQWQRPPTEAELRGLVDARVREEVLYRSAQSMGLDQNDIVVRRRMVQKMELLSQDLATLTDPPQEELQAYFQENREDYRVPPRVSFRHILLQSRPSGRRGRGLRRPNPPRAAALDGPRRGRRGDAG